MNGKHITKLGFERAAIGLALAAATERERAGVDRGDILTELRAVQADPAAYTAGVYAPLAAELLARAAERDSKAGVALRDRPLPYPVWGEDLIEPGARAQMDVAMRLPVSRAGALMPDAHVGYGLPIGGVLATENAVIPYGVGVDIGCSMMLSVLPAAPGGLATDEARALLLKHTRFGAGVGFEKRDREDHAVLHEAAWDDQPLLRHLHDKAVAQVGTSGSGNHFVEFGTLTVDTPDLGLDAGEYLAVLSHSGSRGFGAQVANHFTALAQKRHPGLNPAAKNLAWLPLDSEDGQAYWQAMTLAGRYALANHDLIHARLARALGERPLAQVSNSHNLAWRQVVDGQDVIVHRKGATPAREGQLGLIPGSMADPGFVVRGRGNAGALDSASHGAGRALGRRAAANTLAKKDVQAYLAQRGVTLIGGGIDEAPQAYKRIEDVLARQNELVDVLARFTPRVVRMDTGSEDV
ncbi:tRNA-splicing ligase RtcB [Deinococcus metalli]|uniref:3'-phosphate/5'-hydroxy nucleic acid ligase n=1 Tax=Deinococcus metalli TaxID=1141878 RepID=A0A7W8KIN2_9DEIO|nr:RtcB family protein [Deinococcus metalli]MBB5378894.1 tRNA-splicing ligase RtcB [Deinococcus metalli]GHF62496.1 RNA-splicing ligase RtcB [Deinococcus metalli]